ncbi:MAG: DMT family transporter [Polyangiaceae bacterium]|nr:DMT family transporter [Polyangiaceae bacterium]
MTRTDDQRGVALLIGSALGFSLMSVQVKLAGEELPVATLVLARGVVTLVLSATWLAHRRISPWGNDKKRLLLRAVLGVGGLGCFFYALTVLPLAEATVIHYLNPLLTALVAAFFLREAIRPSVLIAIALALAGTVLIARPAVLFGAANVAPLSGVLAALGGATFSAFAYTTVRRLRLTDDPHVIVFYFPLVAVPATLPFAIASWRTPSATGWLLLLGLGVATQVSQVLLTMGLALVPAGRATTIGYVQILFAAGLGFLVFGERPGLTSALGALLIVSGVLVLVRRPAAPSPENSGP